MDNKLGKGLGKKIWIITGLVLVLLIAGAVGAWAHWHNNAASKTAVKTSPVPQSIAQAVNFPVYYPDPKKLPPGYSLNLNSFKKPVNNGVTYSVSYGNNQKLVFSIQAKPSDNELESFKSSYIPLRIDYQTPIGLAEIGAYNNHGTIHTLVSLPTKSNAWVIVTAPYDTNQDALKQILKSLKK